MKPRIAILDYGVGNLRSVQRGLEYNGAEPIISEKGEDIEASDALVLPGVGAFCDAMKNLQGVGGALGTALKEKPVLGVCLGLQLFFSESEEDGLHNGLGLMDGRVVRLPDDVKIPQMGWNSLELKGESRLLEGIDDGDYFYFVHSYYAVPQEDVTTATTDYGLEMPAVVEKDNVYATQFHPEKSGEKGLRILKNFVEIVKRGM